MEDCAPFVFLKSWVLVVPYLCFRFHIFNKHVLDKYVSQVGPCDAPSHSLQDKKFKNGSIEDMNPKVKTSNERVEVRFLACSTFGVKGHDGVLKWGLGRATSGSIIHTNLHKPNNKLIIV
jgi:hypothetical protein